MNNRWDSIPDKPSHLVKIRSRPGSLIYWAVSAEDKKQLRLIEPSESEFRGATLPAFTGLSIFHEEVDEQFHLVVQLEDQDLLDIFSALCSDLEEQAFSSDEPRNVVIKRLQHWTELLKWRRNGLNALVQQGIYAELIFIKELISIGRSAEDAVSDWKGPNHIHDFTLGDKAVEVKSFDAGAGTGEIHVHNEDQINPLTQMHLHLFVVSVHKNCADGKNLIEMYQELDAMIQDQGTRDLLRQKMLLYGLNLEREPSWLVSFSVEQKYLYEVREDFPSLHRGRIPDAVRTVKYRLSLHHIESYRRPIAEVIQS